MSLILAVCVEEGIVLASDSRVTYNSRIEDEPDGDKIIHHLHNIHFSDNNYKTFICENGSGISTCGDSSVNGKPIAGIIEQFARKEISPDTDVSEIPQMIKDYFSALDKSLNTDFIIAGYHNDNDDLFPNVWTVDTAGEIELQDIYPGAVWRGEIDVLSRMITPLFTKMGDEMIPLENHEIVWQFYSLQDAIDFAQYAIKITSDAMRFQSRIKSVGGAIDILAIKPDKTMWISKKELHA